MQKKPMECSWPRRFVCMCCHQSVRLQLLLLSELFWRTNKNKQNSSSEFYVLLFCDAPLAQSFQFEGLLNYDI